MRLASILLLLVAPLVSASDDLYSSKPSVFNGEEVPPLQPLNGANVTESISHGNWLVEFYSPWCHHCKNLAPTWQTLYEFYYTWKPLASSSDGLNSFTRYYDFQFARLDCVAFGEACEQQKVNSFPTIIYFKDGVEIKKSVGTKSLEDLSNWVEDILESIRPGSRPKGGPTLPKVGDHSVTQPKAATASVGAAPTLVAPGIKDTKLLPIYSASKETPNPTGQSMHLSAEAFQRLVTATRDPWFVKFYAPWCHHCQSMGPNWIEMAREMKGILNIGEVNCDLDRRLCKDAKVKGFPTMLFFRGGERVEYNGLRGVGDLISFARKGIDVGSGVQDVDFETFKKMEETEEVLFLYFYDEATTSEDFAALERLTLSLIGHGKLIKTKDKELCKRFKISTWPRLVVSRDGKPNYYPYLAPRDMRDFRQILSWMKTVWLPLVPEMTASNAKEIMTNSIVVLGVLSRDRSDEFVIAKREMKNAAMEWIDREAHARQLERQELRDAKQLRMEEAQDRGDERALSRARNTRVELEPKQEVKFAWVDGVFWERWIRTTYGIDVADGGEKVVIIDGDNHRYWDNTMTGNPIVPSRTSILETLPRVLANPPKISPKSSVSTLGTIFYKIKSAWSHHPYLSSVVLIAFVLGSVMGTRRLRRKSFGSGGFFNLDGEKGVFGNGAAAKVD